MDSTTFYQLLNQYPVVRGSGYCSDMWIEHNNAYVNVSDHMDTGDTIENKNKENQEMYMKELPSDFYTQLEDYIKELGLSGRRSEILRSFRLNLSSVVSSLNLEDIKDLEHMIQSSKEQQNNV